MVNVPIAWYGSAKEKTTITTTSSHEKVLVNRLTIHLRRAKPTHEKMIDGMDDSIRIWKPCV